MPIDADSLEYFKDLIDYSDGNVAEGPKRLKRVVKKIASISDEIERSEALSELQFDAENCPTRAKQLRGSRCCVLLLVGKPTAIGNACC